MKALISIFSLLFCFFMDGQSVNNTDQHTLKAIAKFISHENGEMISISKFALIKDFSNNAFADTIFIYDSKEIPFDYDIVLLTVNRYGGENTTGKRYFSSPNYDAQNGIHPIRNKQVSMDRKENSDIIEWALKGPIKKINVLKYDQFEQTHNEPINGKVWKNNATVNYNSMGNVSKLTILHKNTVTSKFVETNVSYHYTDAERVGIVLENKKNIISKTDKKWLTNQFYVEEYFDDNSNLFKTTWTFLDRNKRITHQRTEEKYIKSATKIEPFDFYYTFNENNYLEKITTEIQGRDNESYVDKNTDLEFDNYGNPTKSIKVENNKRYLVIRKYEYY